MRERVPQRMRVKVRNARLLAQPFKPPPDAIRGDRATLGEQEPIGAACIRMDAAHPQVAVNRGARRCGERNRPRPLALPDDEQDLMVQVHVLEPEVRQLRDAQPAVAEHADERLVAATVEDVPVVCPGPGAWSLAEVQQTTQFVVVQYPWHPLR